jgi:hypothetical protein
VGEAAEIKDATGNLTKDGKGCFDAYAARPIVAITGWMHSVGRIPPLGDADANTSQQFG